MKSKYNMGIIRNNTVSVSVSQDKLLKFNMIPMKALQMMLEEFDIHCKVEIPFGFAYESIIPFITSAYSFYEFN